VAGLQSFGFQGPLYSYFLEFFDFSFTDRVFMCRILWYRFPIHMATDLGLKRLVEDMLAKGASPDTSKVSSTL
jgi:hypothetical protein